MAGKLKSTEPKEGDILETVEGMPVEGGQSVRTRETTGPLDPAHHARRMQEIERIIKDDMTAMQNSLQPAVRFLNWQLAQERIRVSEARAKGEEVEEKLVLWIGDAHHGKALPSMLTREMVAGQIQRGKAVIEVEEDTSPERIAFEEYRGAKDGVPAHALQKIQDDLRDYKDMIASSSLKINPDQIIEKQLRATLLQEVVAGKRMIHPDPRVHIKPEFALTPEQESIIRSVRFAEYKLASEIGDNCAPVVMNELLTPNANHPKDLEEKKQEIAEAFAQGWKQVEYGGHIHRDQITAQNVADGYAQIVASPSLKPHMMIGEYGNAHFGEGRLHEHFKGEYFPVIPLGEENRQAQSLLSSPRHRNALPKAAWVEARQKKPMTADELIKDYGSKGVTINAEQAGRILNDSGLVMMDAKTLQAYHQQAYGVKLNATQAFHLARGNTASYLNITEAQLTTWETAAGVNSELGRAVQVYAGKETKAIADQIHQETKDRCMAVAAENMPAIMALGAALQGKRSEPQNEHFEGGGSQGIKGKLGGRDDKTAPAR